MILELFLYQGMFKNWNKARQMTLSVRLIMIPANKVQLAIGRHDTQHNDIQHNAISIMTLGKTTNKM
jgi:hypothetical protein